MRRSTLTGVNGVYFVLTAVVLALAPVPIGSNRPFFWSVNAIIIGAMAFVYLGLLANHPERLRLPLRALYWPAVLASISLIWMVVQILPLPFEPFGPKIWSAAGTALGLDLWPRISLDPAATGLMIVNYLTYGLLFFMSAQFCVNEERSHRFMQLLFAIITAHAGIAVVLLFQFGDTLLFLPKWSYRGFATGFFVNRNSLATFLAMGLAIGSSLLVNAVLPRRNSKQNRPFREIFRLDNALIKIAGYGAGIAVMGSTLLLTASRMGAAVGTIGLLLPVIIAAVRSPGRRAVALAAMLVLAIIIVLVALLSGGGLTERFDSKDALQDLRWLLFEQTLGLISHRPFSGFGGGTFQDAFAIYHRLPLSGDVTWDRAHNLYLELFADLGVFAIGIMAAVVYVLWRIGRALFSGAPTVAPVAAFTAAVVALVHSLVDFSLQIEAIELMFVALLGAGYAQAVEAREVQPAEQIEVARPRAARGREAGPFAGPGAGGEIAAAIRRGAVNDA